MPAGRTNLNQTAHPSLSPFPLSPVSSRCPHRTSSSVTSGGGCGQRGSGQAGGDEGWLSFRPIRRAVLPLESAARTRAEASACIHACVHQSPNLSSCVWFCIHVIWGGFFLVVVFFPFLLLLLLLPVCPDTLFCALEALYGQIMDGSCFVSAALPLFLSFHFIWLFYFQQCFKFRRKDIHALFLIAHLCLPCYFCHSNFFFFGFQSSFFSIKCY